MAYRERNRQKMGQNQESVRALKGIGEKTGKLFEKLGVLTVADLLLYYPRDYQVYEPPVSIGELKPDRTGAVGGILQKTATVRAFGHTQVITASLRDGTGSLTLTWFNMPFLCKTLQAGTYHIFYGKVVKKHNRLTMEQPEIFTEEAYQAMTEHMQPIYGQTRGLGNKAISKAVAQALTIRRMEREYLPAYMRKQYELAEYNYAIEHIHFPQNKQELLFARKRLVFDEFFLFLMAVRQLKEKRQDKPSLLVMEKSERIGELIGSLPYELTKAQKQVWGEVEADLSGGLIMNRLIQGDVGSGKTIIAILALLMAAYNGYQGAIMAPTEVLARQHFESMEKLFASNGITKVPVLVTGSMTAKEKRLAYEQIRTHKADIIVGTHALIQEKVVYDKLALVVTDEQHRFGVGQRELLGNKGKAPHVMVMSATPIPRTLAIILYGDLDISVIDELPSNRLPIKTCVVDASYRGNAYAFLRRQIKEGRQAYVICPMVEESELIEAENVLDYTKLLRKELPETAIEFLHGKMKGREKNQIMERFSAGEIQILVSTTVVEVGVNVPNATVILIENAERFGLAQLHQLRGRVGRGKHQSYCIMVNCGDEKETRERLDILNRSNDGFYIASEDLKLRGPGDIFGIRQSGDMEFKLADVFTDARLLQTVSKEVDELLERDGDLAMEEHQELRRRMEEAMAASYDKLNL